MESRSIPRVSKRTVPLLSSAKPAPKESTLLNRKARAQRRKARQREEYLKALQEKGKYDPNRPVKPDPERYGLILQVYFTSVIGGCHAIKDLIISEGARIGTNLLGVKDLVMVRKKICLNWTLLHASLRQSKLRKQLLK